MLKKIVLLALAVCTALCLSGCGGSSKPISISIASSSSTVDGGDSVTLTVTVTNDKNAAGVTWTITNGGGALSNTSTSSATYTAPAATSSQQSVTITATSVAKSTQTGTVTITVAAKPTFPSSITSASLAGSVGAAYSVTLQGSGGIPPYKNWALASGSNPLPSCLQLSSAGVLTTKTGTAPTASCAGTYDPIFTFQDSGTPTPLTGTSPDLTITITAAPAITFSSNLLAGPVGTPYSGSVSASGGAGALTYAVASGALPPDLSLNAATGAITGTPKAADAGTATFTISASDAYGDTATSGSLSITITAPTLSFVPVLPGGNVGAAYAGNVGATGFLGASTYTIASGSLGSDLTLNSSTGAITGTPKASDVGTLTFTVKVVDAYGDTATSGSLSIAIVAPTITFPTTLSGATVGTAYTASVAATGVAGASTYTIATGSLGSDLSLNSSTGAITGTPKATDVGTLTFTIKVVDAYGDTATSGSLSIVIAAAPAITFGAAPTATATAGLAYSSTLAATGGAGALTFSITTGSLPAGLTLNTTTGAITGTPTTVGPVTFTAQAQDGFGDTPATQSYTITVSAGAATHFTVAATSSTTITAGGTVNFTVTAFDVDNNIATGYSGTVIFSSSDAQAALPPNSTLASGTGSFVATLKTAGSQTITATDTVTATISGTTGSITVNPGNASTLVVSAPANATVNVSFSFTVTAKDQYSNTATGYAGTVRFTSTDGSTVLPVNSTLTSGTGSFSATLNTTGSQTITATDTVTSSITGTSGAITVSNTVTITTSSIGPFDSGQTVSVNLLASGGSGNSSNYTWSWVAGSGSSIPPGLTLSTGGAITGTAGTAGSYTVAVTVKDTSFTPNQTFTQNFTITIDPALSLPTPNPSSLPSNGYTGIAYTGSVAASGGSGNYCYTVTGLPSNGLSGPLNNSLCGYVAASFPVSGTPTAATTVTFNLTVKDTTTGNSIGRSYSITINTPTPVGLPAPNPTSLPSATVSQSYSGSITATGGVSPYTWSVNGVSIPSTGSQVTISDGIYVSDTGGSTLSVGGTPTATGTVNLTNVKVVDTASSSATQSYTIAVNNTSNVSGQISPDNYNSCGSTTLPPLPTFTVTLKDSGGNVVQTVSSNSSGQYSFSGVTAGNYTIVPSYAGPTGSTSMFYPASQSITVSTSNITNQNFNVSLGYEVSGTVNYSGTTQGQIYVDLVSNCGSNGNATSISSKGTFTIHGVAPGLYQFLVWMDPSSLNEGSPNEADPTGTLANVTVSTANLTGQTITLTDPTVNTPTATIKIKGISPADKGVVISYGGGSVTDNNGLEIYTSYTVQWSTTTTFSSSNQATFKAAGTNANVWILRTGNANMTGTLSNGTPYYFRVWGTNAGGAGPPATSTTTVTPNPPASGTGLNQVTGTINIPSTVTISSGAPLYLGLYDQFTNTAYAAVIANPSNSVGNTFTVYVPSSPGNAPNYILFGILDQNKDGVIDTGDVTNVNQGGGSGIAITGTTSEPAVTLPPGNANAVVQTQYVSVTSSGSSNPSTSYSLNFDIRQGVKLPVAVTLTGGPNIMNPVDFSSYCQGCGGLQFQDYFNINSDTPSVGDAYTFTVKYSDGTSDTQTATVTGWNGGSSIVGAGDLVTNMLPSGTTGPNAGTRTTPTFSWNYPSSVDSTDVFGFGLYQVTTNGSTQLWQIPGNNSNLNGLPTSLTSITWSVDPSDSTNLPSVSNLTTGTTYDWFVKVQDSNGNQAWNWMWYVP